MVVYLRYGTSMASITSPSSTTAHGELNARSVLLPYFLGLIGLCTILQLVLLGIGSEIGLFALIATIGIAVYYASFLYLKRQSLSQVRFAQFVAHAITFGVVAGSFQLHAAIVTLAGSGVILGTDEFAMEPGWFGVTLAMAGFWAVGLTAHAVAAIAQRGFEK